MELALPRQGHDVNAFATGEEGLEHPVPPPRDRHPGPDAARHRRLRGVPPHPRAGASCRSSCSPPAATIWTWSAGWRRAPTTTWSSRSAAGCWRPVSARSCAGLESGRLRPQHASPAWSSTGPALKVAWRGSEVHLPPRSCGCCWSCPPPRPGLQPAAPAASRLGPRLPGRLPAGGRCVRRLRAKMEEVPAEPALHPDGARLRLSLQPAVKRMPTWAGTGLRGRLVITFTLIAVTASALVAGIGYELVKRRRDRPGRAGGRERRARHLEGHQGAHRRALAGRQPADRRRRSARCRRACARRAAGWWSATRTTSTPTATSAMSDVPGDLAARAAQRMVAKRRPSSGEHVADHRHPRLADRAHPHGPAHRDDASSCSSPSPRRSSS